MSEVFDVILGGLDTEVDVTIADSTGVDPSVLLALRGEKGDTGSTGAPGQDGADGADGFSPIATVSKVGDTATITITDKNGTTTAEVYDGSAGGASAFVAEFNVTPYADVKDAYDDDAIIICTADDSGNTIILQLAYYDDANSIFYFAEPNGDGWIWTSIASDDTWDDGVMQFASTDTATQLRDGLMTALDKQKLDGIASGAEVNVQSDWNQSVNTADDFIKNKPTIPTKVSDLSNDSGFTSTSVTQVVSTGTKIATVTIDGTGTDLYAPSGGGGTITDVEVDGTSVVTGGVAEIDLTGKSDVGHTHTTSAITDFPTAVSSFTNDAGYITGYTETDPIFLASAAHGISSSDISNWNGKSDFSGSYNDLTDKPTIPTVNNATLTIQKNGTNVQTFTANASSNKTANITVPTAVSELTNDSGYITGYTETDPVFSASAASGITSSDISSWNGKSDFSGNYNDLTNKPTIPTITDTYSGTSSNGMSGKAVKSAIDALDGSVTGSAGSGKTLTAFSQTDGKVSATFGSISITKSQVSDFPSLATVATSGSYTDLTDKPTIPTVNNATLTIQKNGKNVATFTANASSNVTANISVPTDTSDLTNTAGFITLADLPIYNGGVS